MATAAPARRAVGRRRGPLQRLGDLYRYRELLGNFVRKELKVKYKNSALGFFWTLLNPLLYLVIFSVVLGVFLRSGVPWFPLYLLSGLLAWNFFSMTMSSATHSIVSNASLVTKVFFPREIIPLSSLGAAFVHFVLQFGILVAAMLIVGYQRFWDSGLVLLPVAILVQVVFMAGLALLLSSVNVYFRDVQHLVELAMLAWFWFTPIVYPIEQVREPLTRQAAILWQLYLANPMAAVVLGYQRALYAQLTPEGHKVLLEQPVVWYLKRLGYAGAGSALVLVAAWWLFHRLEARFAEEL